MPWLLLAWLLLGPLAHAQAPLRKDLRRDFGAVGDGRTDDQAAFRRAADFFNARAKTPAGAGLAELVLPAGTYRVGTPGGPSVPGLLVLLGCRNLIIRGVDSARTLIRYADSLRYGAFTATGQPYEAPTAYATPPGGQGSGTAIELRGCDNVEVRDLALDGNSPHLVVGGHWGDTGIQLGADGLFVSDSRRVQLRRLAVHHFGRDGIQVLNHLAKGLGDPSREGIVLENSRFDYSGRQGLSITGASGLRAINCSFSHTGRVVIPALGKPLFSNPGAGIDIEPEGGVVAHVLLENCRLVDNAGQGLVSDRYGDGPPSTADIVLRGCLLWGTTNWSAWVRQPGFLFENCQLYGAFENGCRAREPSWATRFVGCTFEDRPYHGQPAYGVHLLDSQREARGMSFENCRFVGTQANLLLAVPAAPDSASRFRLHNCTLVLNQAAAPLGPGNVLASAVLSGRCAVLSGPARTDSAVVEFSLGVAGVPASAVVQAGGRLQLLAPRCRYRLPGGLQLRDNALLEIGTAAQVELPAPAVGPVAPELRVAPDARLVVRAGGALAVLAGTRLVLAGQLVVEDGAYFYLDPGATLITLGQGRVQLAAGAIRGRRPE
jgi:hypothetical protein